MLTINLCKCLKSVTAPRKHPVAYVTTLSKPGFEFPAQVPSHVDLQKFSVENPDLFWGSLAKSKLKWTKAFNTVQQCDMSKGQFSWFLNGQLNVSGLFMYHF